MRFCFANILPVANMQNTCQEQLCYGFSVSYKISSILVFQLIFKKIFGIQNDKSFSHISDKLMEIMPRIFFARHLFCCMINTNKHRIDKIAILAAVLTYGTGAKIFHEFVSDINLYRCCIIFCQFNFGLLNSVRSTFMHPSKEKTTPRMKLEQVCS